MKKFIIYGGSSYPDTHDKNRYRLPAIYKFNPEKINMYKGIPKENYNDIILFNDNSYFELGNVVPLIQLKLLNIQNKYLNKKDAEKDIGNINNFFYEEIWKEKESFIKKEHLNLHNVYNYWIITNFRNILMQKARRQIKYYSDSIDFFGAILNKPDIFIQRILNLIFHALVLKFKGDWAFFVPKGEQSYIYSARYHGLDYIDFNLEKLIPLKSRGNKYIYLRKLVTNVF